MSVQNSGGLLLTTQSAANRIDACQDVYDAQEAQYTELNAALHDVVGQFSTTIAAEIDGLNSGAAPVQLWSAPIVPQAQYILNVNAPYQTNGGGTMRSSAMYVYTSTSNVGAGKTLLATVPGPYNTPSNPDANCNTMMYSFCLPIQSAATYDYVNLWGTALNADGNDWGLQAGTGTNANAAISLIRLGT